MDDSRSIDSEARPSGINREIFESALVTANIPFDEIAPNDAPDEVFIANFNSILNSHPQEVKQAIDRLIEENGKKE
jgi:hypothetical protein